MRFSLAITGVLFLMSFGMSEVTRYIYKEDGLHVEYAKEHGMLTSTYRSYWPNGNVKAEGTMKANMRFGTWNVYDSTGKLVMARDYETGYAWTQLYPIAFTTISSKGWFGSRFSLYVDIKPDSVIHSARMWRFLPFVEHSPIFARNAVLDTIIAMRNRGAIQCGEDDQMTVLSSMSEFNARMEKCNPQHHVIGYRVKEDWYYDAKKQMAITSIINICPVIYAKNERDSIDVGWFMFDATLRNKLATMFYNPQHSTGYPVGVEQTFFLRCFESDVYKYTNIGYKTIAQMYPDKAAREKEIQRTEIQPFEWEHDHWLSTFK